MMGQYRMMARSIPLDDSWDVIVVGGGPAGCAAAAAASREGARTLLIEQSGCLGGMGTLGLVPAWTPVTDQQQLIYGGLFDKVFRAACDGVAHIRPEDTEWVPIDAERLKRAYDELVREHGVEVLFQTMLSAVETNGNGTVHTIIVTNKAGLSAKRAKVFVDCTGDADLCAWAGAAFQKGDETGDPQSLMPATHCFVLSNVDEYGYRYGPALWHGNPQSPMYEILASGKYRIPDLHCVCAVVGPGTIGFNAGHLYAVDSTDPASISKALMDGRRMAAEFRDALAEFHPRAFANAHLAATGSSVGIRESRRIVGDYTLTLRDYLQRRSFADEICRNNYFIDVHAKVREAFNDLKQMERWETATLRYGKGESHGIPYRCLIPQGLENVLVAGRSVSTEQTVQGSVRVMPCCVVMGEAAGLAAAMAAQCPDPRVREVNTNALRLRLGEHGAYLPQIRAELTSPAGIGAEA